MYKMTICKGIWPKRYTCDNHLDLLILPLEIMSCHLCKIIYGFKHVSAMLAPNFSISFSRFQVSQLSFVFLIFPYLFINPNQIGTSLSISYFPQFLFEHPTTIHIQRKNKRKQKHNLRKTKQFGNSVVLGNFTTLSIFYLFLKILLCEFCSFPDF